MRLLGTLIMVVGALSASCAAKTAASMTTMPIVTPKGVRFAVRYPGATSVAVAGSFNRWSATSHPLNREASTGLWSLLITLTPGEHLFMYVVNGTEWISPPQAEDYIDDGFGTRNGIVIVRVR
jgi:1,4-alpha-glucan branching enzyme